MLSCGEGEFFVFGGAELLLFTRPMMAAVFRKSKAVFEARDMAVSGVEELLTLAKRRKLNAPSVREETFDLGIHGEGVIAVY